VTVHVTFGSTGSGGEDFDFVVTSGLHEWSTSWHGETEESVSWDCGCSYIDLEGVKSFSTIVHECSTSNSILCSIVLRDPERHGGKDVHGALSNDFVSALEDVMVDHGSEELSIGCF